MWLIMGVLTWASLKSFNMGIRITPEENEAMLWDGIDTQKLKIDIRILKDEKRLFECLKIAIDLHSKGAFINKDTIWEDALWFYQSISEECSKNHL